MGDCRLGPPLGEAAGKAGRVRSTILPSLAAASATLEVMVLPPFSKKLKYGEVAPVHCSVKAGAAKTSPAPKEVIRTRLKTIRPKPPSQVCVDRRAEEILADMIILLCAGMNSNRQRSRIKNFSGELDLTAPGEIIPGRQRRVLAQKCTPRPFF